MNVPSAECGAAGKTSLINNLIGQEYEGSHVDPEPTTDCFTAVCWGATSNVLKGNAASIAAGLPYQGLESFGQGFLGKFRACLTNTPDSSVLKRVSLIDTPGVLSGDKQRIGRSYDFAAVIFSCQTKCDSEVVATGDALVC